MNVEVYKYAELGYAIDPESDTKEITVIIIGKQLVKCNPRPVVIYLTGGKVHETYEKIDELKTYCCEKKVMFLCPLSNSIDELAKTYKYIQKNAKELNVVPEKISISSNKENIKTAENLKEFLEDEFDFITEIVSTI